jgi:hypothetical protein
MSNKHIAINWAVQQTKNTTGFVYSDKFFEPFTNFNTRNKITQELLARNVIAWTDTRDGVFLFNKGDSRLTVESDGKIKVGVWMEDENILVLPATQVN